MAKQVVNDSRAVATPTIEAPGALQPVPSLLRRWNRKLVLGMAILSIAGGAALAAPWISPYPPEYQEIANRLQGPTSGHWLGTDTFGRDLLSRLIWGGRVSLSVGLLAMVIAVTVGVIIGTSSGYFGRVMDAVLMRFTELILVFPIFFLLILILATFGRSVTLLIVVLGLTSWPVSARIIRGEVLKIRERDYVLAARALGATNLRIILIHILPNIASVVIVSATVRVAMLILVEAGLSFLGLGVQEPMSSWGTMISSGASFIRSNWWLVAAPGLAIFFSVLGFNLLGEGLRDLLNPRQRKARTT